MPYPVSAKCPFCDHDIEIDSEASYIEASLAELHRIHLQIQDLMVSESELVTERHEIDYGNGTTIIRFTKDETIGRYGFLMDAR